jgi:hypothetical protein
MSTSCRELSARTVRLAGRIRVGTFGPPVVLITAGAAPDERRAAEHIQAGSPATVQVWTASGAGHTRSLAVHPAEWEARVVAFLRTGLGLPPEP